MFRRIKELLLGQPIPTDQADHQRLSKRKALAVFSSDALSSVAYATEEILIPLAIYGVPAVGVYALNWSFPLALAICGLIALVSISYMQTIRAYPHGGGGYVVCRENLGTKASLFTGAALLTDYILTVSVSIAAGVAAITSAFPALQSHGIGLAGIFILFITVANLRGVKESGTIFAIPTYFFIGCFFIMIVSGIYKFLAGDVNTLTSDWQTISFPELSYFLILKAFTAGCTALTGIEAISDGVPAFKPKESQNARTTLLWMVIILSVLFSGITFLAHIYHVLPMEHETVVSQIARQVFGNGIFYYLIQISTTLILILAANTAYADFPRLASFMARDGFLPRQLNNRGDRLVFSNGIFFLGLVSFLLIIIFKGRVHALIPLYAVGVFITFTTSQTGMVVHHLRKKEKGWLLGLVINSLGALTTFIVLWMVIVTKFTHGAWLIVVAIPVVVYWLLRIKAHYVRVAKQLNRSDIHPVNAPFHNTVVVPISGIHRGVIDAVRYAKSLSTDLHVITVDLDKEQTENLKKRWKDLDCGIPLEVLQSPYRSVTTPILDYVKAIPSNSHTKFVTVVIPEFVTAKWYEGILHNQSALLIRTSLLFEPGKVVTSIRYHLAE